MIEGREARGKEERTNWTRVAINISKGEIKVDWLKMYAGGIYVRCKVREGNRRQRIGKGKGYDGIEERYLHINV
jgi:hypothetical protein